MPHGAVLTSRPGAAVQSRIGSGGVVEFAVGGVTNKLVLLVHGRRVASDDTRRRQLFPLLELAA